MSETHSSSSSSSVATACAMRRPSSASAPTRSAARFGALRHHVVHFTPSSVNAPPSGSSLSFAQLVRGQHGHRHQRHSPSPDAVHQRRVRDYGHSALRAQRPALRHLYLDDGGALHDLARHSAGDAQARGSISVPRHPAHGLCDPGQSHRLHCSAGVWSTVRAPEASPIG